MLNDLEDDLVSRLLAAVLISATIGSAGPGGVFFRCRFDGVVRSACCCEHERSRDDQRGPGQSIESGCCDVLVQSPVTREAVKADAPAGVSAPQLVVLSEPTPWPTSAPAAWVQQVRWTGPPNPGHLLFLEIRSLLI